MTDTSGCSLGVVDIKTKDVLCIKSIIHLNAIFVLMLTNTDLESGAVEEDVGRVEDVRGVDAVVVGDVGDVVVAQRHEERQQRLLGDLEGVAQVAVLEERITLVQWIHGRERNSIRAFTKPLSREALRAARAFQFV